MARGEPSCAAVLGARASDEKPARQHPAPAPRPHRDHPRPLPRSHRRRQASSQPSAPRQLLITPSSVAYVPPPMSLFLKLGGERARAAARSRAGAPIRSHSRTRPRAAGSILEQAAVGLR